MVWTRDSLVKGTVDSGNAFVNGYSKGATYAQLALSNEHSVVIPLIGGVAPS